MSPYTIASIVISSAVCFILLLYIFLRWYTWRRANRINPDIPRVPVNPSEYAGTWFEIASYPAWFQRGCTQTKAHYEPKNDYIEVKNTCFRNGQWTDIYGSAYKTDYDGVLAVEFFPGLYGNYTVTYRDKSTSIVTNVDKSKLWILSRKVTMSEKKKQKLLTWLKSHHFDTEKLQFSQ
jgi:apolipoprotein D and lipocalin family protein